MTRIPQVAIVVALLSHGGLATQQPVFSSSTTRVRLDVSVTSSDGVVRGLAIDDFVVTSNGRPVSDPDLLELSDLPLDLVVVAQSRGALTADQDQVFQQALSGIMSSTRDGDRIALITTSPPPQVLFPLGPRGRSLGSPINTSLEGALWDAIALAVQQFDGAERRQVIAVLSTGIERRSLLSPRVVLQAARRSRAQVVYLGFDVVPTATIRLSTRSGTSRITEETSVERTNRFPPVAFKEIAEETGGQVVNLVSGPPETVAGDVVNRLRFGYVLSFAPASEAGWHQVDIAVRRPRTDVLARKGYVR